MKFRNHDVDNSDNNFKQLFDFTPDRCFRMLICGPSGSGKTNVLINMILYLLYYDKIYTYGKNLEQSKYQFLLRKMKPINKETGYEVIETFKKNDKTFQSERHVSTATSVIFS